MPGMAPSADLASYKEIMLFLATAGVVVPLFSRIRVSPVLGFIGAGALLGPFGLGRFTAQAPFLDYVTIANTSEVSHLAEFGVVFLLFTIGIELSFERLRTLRRLVFGLGAGQVILSALAIGALAFALGLPAGPAAIAGIALALSSTAIVIPILAAQKRLNSPTGRLSFSILLFQDLAVAPVLFTIAALDSAPGSGGLLKGLVIALAQAVIALVALVLVGRVVLRPLFHLVAQTRSPELFMAACLLVVVGTALIAAASGLSMALGAFVAGLLLAETEYRRAIEAMVDPFKGLLLGVFFVSVGLGLDVTAIARAPVAIVVAAGAVIVFKAAITYGLARLFRLPPRVGAETGLLIGAGGEFAFVLVAAAVAAGLVPADVGQALLIVASVSMVAIPFLARVARRLGLRLAATSSPTLAAEPPPGTASGHVIVAGYGRVGQLVSDMLTRHGIPYLAIDMNPAIVAAQRELGRPVYYGDSSSPMFLRACGLEAARGLVITLDLRAEVEAIVSTVRRWQPNLTIVARARDDRHARELYRAGVTDAVPETIEASLQLSEAVLVDMGVAMGPVIASIHERREEFRRLFQAAADAPDGVADASDHAAANLATPERRRAGEFRSRRTAGKR